ncbi:GatB/YqeY domain-containing protein [Thalassospira australica]|uniref:GatB/YqeY domain-containing protein n=1 Tax=Thalassospira australica TaxID=1528106 RepID=UPI0038507BDF
MLRSQLTDALKKAVLEKDAVSVTTVRLILAALKERDIAARGEGNTDGISDEEILTLLQAMVKQRRESIEMYTKGNRPELAAQEAAEIGVIERFLPKQMSDEEIEAAVKEVVTDLGATCLKDMGRTMAVLREKYASCMDFGKAGGVAKKLLG